MTTHTYQSLAGAVESAIAIIDGNRNPRPSEREVLLPKLQVVRQKLWDAALKTELKTENAARERAQGDEGEAR